MVLHFQRDQTIIYIYIRVYIYIYLVGGLEHFFIFPSIGNVIIPTDELHHFSEGLKPLHICSKLQKDREVMLFTAGFRPHFAKFHCFVGVASDVYSVYNHNPFHIK